MSAKITFTFEGTSKEFFDFISSMKTSNFNHVEAEPEVKITRAATKETKENIPLFEGGRSDPLTPDAQKSVQADVQTNRGSRYNFPREYGERVDIPAAKNFDVNVALLWSNFIHEFSAGILDDRPHPELPRDRVALVTELATDKLHGKLLQEIVAVGGIQCAIRNILSKESSDSTGKVSRVFLPDADIEKLAGVLVQISHVALPELADIYDYSSKWRRE